MPINLVNFNQNVAFTDTVYADANLLCFARDRLSSKYPTAAIILGNLVVQQVRICISTLVIDEIWWAHLRGWYRQIKGKKLTPWLAKTDPSILPRFSELIRRNTRKILRIPNVVVLPRGEDPVTIIQTAVDIYNSQGLMPRDCFHLAYVITHGISGFITSNGDFDTLNFPNYNLTVYKY